MKAIAKIYRRVRGAYMLDRVRGHLMRLYLKPLNTWSEDKALFDALAITLAAESRLGDEAD